MIMDKTIMDKMIIDKMLMDKTIIHVDIDTFYAAVEVRDLTQAI